MKRSFAPLLLAACAAFLATACSSGGSAGSLQDEPPHSGRILLDDQSPPAPADEDTDTWMMLDESRTWMYQLDGLERPEAIEQLAGSSFDVLVVEPTATLKGSETFDMGGMVKKLRMQPKTGRRVVLAYMNIGQAENYRSYWAKNWRPPGKGTPADPSFILSPDPDGWDDNFLVSYWDERWQQIWLGGDSGGVSTGDGLVSQIAKAGFDGVYLDWVGAYEEEKVISAARRPSAEARDPAEEMLSFIKKIKDRGTTASARPQRQNQHGFLIVAQNAPYLIDKNPKAYSEAIDALAMEDTWLTGEPNAEWGDPEGGDILNTNRDKWGTTQLLKQYDKVRTSGPIFTVDYSLSEVIAKDIYEMANESGLGLKPLVTQVSLSRMTETPPLLP